MERIERRTELAQIVCDFLVPGETEPLYFVPEGPHALRAGATLAELQGELEQGLFELLELTYYLEGKGDSPAAAVAIREAILAVPAAAAALGIKGENAARSLKELAKKRARKKNRDRSSQGAASINICQKVLSNDDAASAGVPVGSP